MCCVSDVGAKPSPPAHSWPFIMFAHDFQPDISSTSLKLNTGCGALGEAFAVPGAGAGAGVPVAVVPVGAASGWTEPPQAARVIATTIMIRAVARWRGRASSSVKTIRSWRAQHADQRRRPSFCGVLRARLSAHQLSSNGRLHPWPEMVCCVLMRQVPGRLRRLPDPQPYDRAAEVW